MRAIRVHAPGGPEALRLDEIPVPEPASGQALVRIEAAGVNYTDVYHRNGFYFMATPFTLGSEAAGTVERVGPGVTLFKPGERVAWAAGALGAYAEYAAVPEARLVRLPEGVSARQAAAALLQGMTAHYLATDVFRLEPGNTCLIHAAAGGVGLLLCQVAKLRGARVIGTVSTDEKARLAKEAGADAMIIYTREDVAPEVHRLTDGRGVDVVYDGVGKATFEASLTSLRPRGMLVLFGQASGAVTSLDPLVLMKHHSLFLTRCNLADYTASREELDRRSREVLARVKEGRLKLRIFREYPLAEASAAHRDLESRATTGKLLLIP